MSTKLDFLFSICLMLTRLSYQPKEPQKGRGISSSPNILTELPTTKEVRRQCPITVTSGKLVPGEVFSVSPGPEEVGKGKALLAPLHHLGL